MNIQCYGRLELIWWWDRQISKSIFNIFYKTPFIFKLWLTLNMSAKLRKPNVSKNNNHVYNITVEFPANCKNESKSAWVRGGRLGAWGGRRWRYTCVTDRCRTCCRAQQAAGETISALTAGCNRRQVIASNALSAWTKSWNMTYKFKYNSFCVSDTISDNEHCMLFMKSIT